MKKGSKILIALVTVFAVFSMTGNVHAADDGVVENRKGWGLQRKFIEKLTGAIGENTEQLVGKMAYGAADYTLGVLAPESTEAAAEIASSDLPDSMKKGVAGLVDHQVMAMFQGYPNPDTMGHLAQEWVPGYSSENSAYANGYQDLQDANIVQFWNKTRNLAYVLYVVIFIAIGFMIMFRHQLGGQTMVTLGNTLPNIIITLILVTFSFAIAGLIIDFGGLILNVVANLIYDDPASSAIAVHTPLRLGLSGIFSSAGLTATGVSVGVGAIIAGIITSFGAFTPVAIVGLIIAIVVACFVIWGAIKLWIALVKSYLGILVNVILGPLQLMSGALPGNSAAIGNWFKAIFRNVLVFPVAFAIVNLPMAIATAMESKPGWDGFPGALVWGDTSSAGLHIGGLILSAIRIFAIYFAANTPEYLSALIPATQSKAMAEFSGAVKGGLSKVPLVGGMFK